MFYHAASIHERRRKKDLGWLGRDSAVGRPLGRLVGHDGNPESKAYRGAHIPLGGGFSLGWEKGAMRPFGDSRPDFPFPIPVESRLDVLHCATTTNMIGKKKR